MNRSPERNTFQLNSYLERYKEDSEEPNEDYINLYKDADKRDMEKEENAQWKLNNLEYDLRSNKWICDKAKTSETYAQNLYAAMCNNEFQKQDVWQVLKDAKYSCSWRYAGGIIADMIEKGDYINWYCSGIRGGDSPDAFDVLYEHKRFVPEGTVTDEVREDFFKLGWILVEVNDDEN